MTESICEGGKLHGTEFATSTENKSIRAIKNGVYLGGDYYRTKRLHFENDRVIWIWVKNGDNTNVE